MTKMAGTARQRCTQANSLGQLDRPGYLKPPRSRAWVHDVARDTGINFGTSCKNCANFRLYFGFVPYFAFAGYWTFQLKDYQGGRTFEDLKKFAGESLGPQCGPGENYNLCDDKVKAKIDKFSKLSVAELQEKIGVFKLFFNRGKPFWAF